MSHITIDSRTYDRLVQFATGAGVSVHAAASDAVENWLDITSDPRLAITALAAIATTEPDQQAIPAVPAEIALPLNVSYINASRRFSPQPPNESGPRFHGVSTKRSVR
jgi:hypothetical protein